jgi:TonB family protein
MTTSTFQLTFVDERKRNWRSFGLSFAAQSLGVVLLVQFGVIKPQEFINPRRNMQAMELTAPRPEPEAHPTQRIIVKQAPPKFVAPKLEMARLDMPIHLTTQPKIKQADVEPPRVVVHNFPAATDFPKVAPPKLAPQVQTGVFSEGSSAKPTLAKSVEPRNVQTGGFGDPNGINGTAKGNGEAKLVAARMGGFDMPLGPGYGNGTGGAKGVRGTVASSGFGNGVATQAPGIPHGRAVQQSGFGDTRPASELPRQAKAAVPALAPATPVEIVSKPTPAYTAEARDLKLEGEVLLEVNFAADGTPSILRVVRGLGHGLDENAVKAAQKIKYKPAKREGQPVDSVAMLHVVFQLAY